MKRMLLSLVMVAVVAGQAFGLSYSGIITSTPGGGMDATFDWANGGASFAWTVTGSPPGVWRYDYVWNADRKSLSHLDLEVSGNFTAADILSWMVLADIDGEMVNITDQTNLEPGGGPGVLNEVSNSIFGYKWDLPDGEILGLELIVDSTRAPMWGDFYAKDGLGGAVFARNSLFGIDPGTTPIGNGNNGGFILCPDTTETVVPEPSSVLLMGAGVLLVAGLRRKLRTSL